MANVDFPVGHPIIRRGDHACRHLLDDLEKQGTPFIGLCMVKVVAPKGLMVPYLPHKSGGTLMFFLSRTCSLNDTVQCRACVHNELERSWVDTYTSIDIDWQCGAFKVGYRVVEYYEIWHYPQGGRKVFKKFILNIVHRKIVFWSSNNVSYQ